MGGQAGATRDDLPGGAGAGGVPVLPPAEGGAGNDGGVAGVAGAAGSGGDPPIIMGGPYPGEALPIDYIESPTLGYYSQYAGTGIVCPEIPDVLPYCLYYGALGSRPYLINSAAACGAHNQATEFAGFGTVLGANWYNSLTNYIWENEFDDKYNGQKGVSPWPATWNGALVGLELEVAEGGPPDAGAAVFTVDWQKRWWKGPDDGSMEITFAPEGLVADLPAYPIVGRWRREYGQRLGVYQNDKFYLDWDGDNAWSDADLVVTFSAPGLYPAAVDFTPGGGDELAVYADGQWYIDLNGNYTWDGEAGGDAIRTFGEAGSVPVPTRDGWVRHCD